MCTSAELLPWPFAVAAEGVVAMLPLVVVVDEVLLVVTVCVEDARDDDDIEDEDRSRTDAFSALGDSTTEPVSLSLWKVSCTNFMTGRSIVRSEAHGSKKEHVQPDRFFVLLGRPTLPTRDEPRDIVPFDSWVPGAGEGTGAVGAGGGLADGSYGRTCTTRSPLQVKTGL
jgi:hypothetical protein